MPGEESSLIDREAQRIPEMDEDVDLYETQQVRLEGKKGCGGGGLRN